VVEAPVRRIETVKLIVLMICIRWKNDGVAVLVVYVSEYVRRFCKDLADDDRVHMQCSENRS